MPSPVWGWTRRVKGCHRASTFTLRMSVICIMHGIREPARMWKYIDLEVEEEWGRSLCLLDSLLCVVIRACGNGLFHSPLTKLALISKKPKSGYNHFCGFPDAALETISVWPLILEQAQAKWYKSNHMAELGIYAPRFRNLRICLWMN